MFMEKECRIWYQHIFLKSLALNLNENADISIFLKKEEKDISSQISLELAFTDKKSIKTN